MSDVQRWTSNSVAPSDAGGFVAYGDYSELRTKLAESQARELRMREALGAVVHRMRETPAVQGDEFKDLGMRARAALNMRHDDSALREMIEAAKAEERDACAKVCDPKHGLRFAPNYADGLRDCAAAIRARGDK